jgi:hypothetical protein
MIEGPPVPKGAERAWLRKRDTALQPETARPPVGSSLVLEDLLQPPDDVGVVASHVAGLSRIGIEIVELM